MAELTTLPRSIIEKARNLAERLRADAQNRHSDSQIEEITKTKKLNYLAHRLLHLLKIRESTSPDLLSGYLKNLQLREKNDQLV